MIGSPRETDAAGSSGDESNSVGDAETGSERCHRPVPWRDYDQPGRLVSAENGPGDDGGPSRETWHNGRVHSDCGAFEGFRSDWHIAAINRDSQALQGKLLAYVQGQLKAGAYPELEQRVRVDLPTHPPLDL